jgi:DNA-binding beta-propeller fold protein YncE
MKKLIFITLSLIIIFISGIYFIPKIGEAIDNKPSEVNVINTDGVFFEWDKSEYPLIENKYKELSDIKDFPTQGYKCEKINNLDLDLYVNNLSTEWYGENILVQDTKHNRILVIDKSGNVIKTIGKTGNGPGEFLTVAGFCFDDEGKLYVVEEDNERIQIFDKNFKYIEEISLTEIKKQLNGIAFQELSIAVTKSKDIYVSYFYVDKDHSGGILYISSDRKTIKRLGDRHVGILNLSGDGNTVYLMESDEVQNKKNANGLPDLVSASGKNNLLKIVDGKIIEAYEIPKGFSATCSKIYDDHIYSFCFGVSQLVEFDLNGNYISTLFDLGDYNIPESYYFSGLIKDENDVFYGIHTDTMDLYKFYKN